MVIPKSDRNKSGTILENNQLSAKNKGSEGSEILSHVSGTIVLLAFQRRTAHLRWEPIGRTGARPYKNAESGILTQDTSGGAKRVLPITHAMMKEALRGQKNNQTVKSYKAHLKSFDFFAKTQGIRSLKDIPGEDDRMELCQNYADHLREKYSSAATVHTYLAPVCRGLGINMRSIDKPKRSSGNIIRGRSLSERDLTDRKKPEFNRVVRFQRAVGCRRAELGRLTRRNIIEGKDGYLYVEIKKGKGGKDTMQRILPEDRKSVLEVVRSSKSEKIFAKEELNNKINFHAMRADQAKKAYSFYMNKIQMDPKYEKQLKRDLIERFVQSHKGYKLSKSETGKRKILDKFIQQMEGGSYEIRGDNRRIAVAEGMPVKYNRTALMAVSVYHLSHWRLGVTVTNYLLK